MKEATGELNMTVITVVAIAAIGLLFYQFIWPMIKLRLVDNTCNAMGSNYEAARCTVDATSGSATATGNSGKTYVNCQAAEEDEAGGKTYCCCQVQ